VCRSPGSRIAVEMGVVAPSPVWEPAPQAPPTPPPMAGQHYAKVAKKGNAGRFLDLSTNGHPWGGTTGRRMLAPCPGEVGRRLNAVKGSLRCVQRKHGTFHCIPTAGLPPHITWMRRWTRLLQRPRTLSVTWRRGFSVVEVTAEQPPTRLMGRYRGGRAEFSRSHTALILAATSWTSAPSTVTHSAPSGPTVSVAGTGSLSSTAATVRCWYRYDSGSTPCS
jgi:hypothetical protein